MMREQHFQRNKATSGMCTTRAELVVIVMMSSTLSIQISKTLTVHGLMFLGKVKSNNSSKHTTFVPTLHNWYSGDEGSVKLIGKWPIQLHNEDNVPRDETCLFQNLYSRNQISETLVLPQALSD